MISDLLHMQRPRSTSAAAPGSAPSATARGTVPPEKPFRTVTGTSAAINGNKNVRCRFRMNRYDEQHFTRNPKFDRTLPWLTSAKLISQVPKVLMDRHIAVLGNPVAVGRFMT